MCYFSFQVLFYARSMLVADIISHSMFKMKGTFSSYNRRAPVSGFEPCVNRGLVNRNLSVQERLDNLALGLDSIVSSPSPPPALEKKVSRFEASAINAKLSLSAIVHVESQIFEM